MFLEETQKINLLGLDRRKLEALFVHLGHPRYRAHQVLQWIHTYGVMDFHKMTNISKELRQQLTEIAIVQVPQVLSSQQAKDGTQKWLLRFSGGSAIETVLIPGDDRATLCISSQAGCTLNCRFCQTGRQGFHRNLHAAEIIAQVWIVFHHLKSRGCFVKRDRLLTNVVFMGMGEPLLNFANVLTAINILRDDLAYSLSKKRITVSTAGIVPGIEQLSQATDVSLALSLHAPTDKLRTELVPLNKKYSIAKLMTACQRYIQGGKRRIITIEYIMLKSINDQPEQAMQLVKLLKDLSVKVNLIPFNPFPGTQYTRSEERTVSQFRDILMSSGIMTLTRKARGEDIAAACGQLAGNICDRTKRSIRLKKEVEQACQ